VGVLGRLKSLEPAVDGSVRVLILGSMPGNRSLNVPGGVDGRATGCGVVRAYRLLLYAKICTIITPILA
jgi:hypothetical protein